MSLAMIYRDSIPFDGAYPEKKNPFNTPSIHDNIPWSLLSPIFGVYAILPVVFLRDWIDFLPIRLTRSVTKPSKNNFLFIWFSPWQFSQHFSSLPSVHRRIVRIINIFVEEFPLQSKWSFVGPETNSNQTSMRVKIHSNEQHYLIQSLFFLSNNVYRD